MNRVLLAAIVCWVFCAGAGGIDSAEPWRQASPEYRVVLPRDHASHPEYKIEWWYYTGNVVAGDGHRFGYQLTFFRIGVDYKPANPSRWAVRDLYAAHLAISDISGRRYRFRERFNRSGPGWAGAASDHYEVWNQGWSIGLAPDGWHTLKAADSGIGLELALDPGKRPVLHGQQGFSQKGRQPGNASIYYSLTRMPTTGWLVMDGQRFPVQGFSWMDHEFGTSFLEPQASGWDWLGLQFDDGTDLMLFQIRRADGQRDDCSAGTAVGVRGETSSIASHEFGMEPLETWRSAQSGAEYPVRWRIRIPGRGVDITVTAAMPDQELNSDNAVTYWEGAVTVTGVANGKPVTGRGYLEMTGYAGQAMGSLFR
jgi:predicted secreted hydrolase